MQGSRNGLPFFVCMIHTVLGKKIDQSQRFLEDGSRIPITKISVSGNLIIMVKTKNKHGYQSVQLGFGVKKNPNKSLLGISKGAKLDQAPLFLREARFLDLEVLDQLPKVGELIKAEEILKAGDTVDVSSVSKGKGFAGVVKRYHFKGGPRTHGQSDRERAPGSIGQATTPGRVYKGKRMAGKMGHATVTVKNLTVVDVSNDLLLIKGLVPGPKDSRLVIKKVGEWKKFVPLYKEEIKEEKSKEAESGSLRKEEKHAS